MSSKNPLNGIQVKDLNSLLRDVVDEYYPVAGETGWKVIIHGVWCQKRNGNRMYSSKNSAKEFTERAFKRAHYYRMLKDHAEAEKTLYHFFHKALPKSFRKWMNSLYAAGIVRYEEVK